MPAQAVQAAPCKAFVLPVQQFTAAAEAAARAGNLHSVPAVPPRPKGRIQVGSDSLPSVRPEILGQSDALVASVYP